EMNIQPLPPPPIVETADLNKEADSEPILNGYKGSYHSYSNGRNGHNGNGKTPTSRPGEKSTKP
ncbi:MAG TPA: hypothetical protein DD761_16410, partial [Cyanobacteria bacterium UBA11691]|nr:hypothetical protein [Cyanobacteria bacterium UBA11691]